MPGTPSGSCESQVFVVPWPGTGTRESRGRLLRGPLEGLTVVSTTYGHGPTLGDVAGLPALLLGGAVLALALPA